MMCQMLYTFNGSYLTVGGFESNRTDFTKMRVTALIIVQSSFLTQSLKYIETLCYKNQSNRTIIKAVKRILAKPVSVTFKTTHCIRQPAL